MILTLAAVLVEVIILAIMMGHNHSPTLARDTIYSAVMLDMNGILGLAVLQSCLVVLSTLNKNSTMTLVKAT